MNLTDIKHLFDYTEWANGRVIDAVSKLSDEDFRRDVRTSHTRFLEPCCIWRARNRSGWKGGTAGHQLKIEAWPLWTTESCANLEILKERWRDVIDRRAHFISELDEERLGAELPFKLLSGEPSSMRLSIKCSTSPITQRCIAVKS